MKFACDSCHAQYMISDEKVGPNGVIVRCKKCQHKIVVKRPVAEESDEDRSEATVVMSNPMAALATAPESAGPPTAEVPAAPFEMGLDDDIGRAFDSVLSEPAGSGELTAPGTDPLAQPAGGFPFASSGGGAFEDDDPDRQSTRVVNLAEMASLMKPDARSPEPERKPDGASESEKPSEPAKDGASSIEWFVAINDQQVGPLDFEGVRKHWDSGELSADSLVWHAGMGDWTPVSGVPELADRLAPPPPKPEIPEPSQSPGSDAAGTTPVPSPSVLPPPQAEPEEPVWKPSAASALEALVKDELDALEKAPAKPEPEPVGVGAPASSTRGLFDELPDAPEPPAAPLPQPQAAVLPRIEAAPRAEAERPPVQAAPRVDYSAPPAPAFVSPQPPRSRMGLFVALGIGGGLLGLGALVLALVLFKQPAVNVLPPGPAPQAVQPTPVAPAEPAVPVVAQPENVPPATVQPPANPAQEPAATDPQKVEDPKAPAQPPAESAKKEEEKADEKKAALERDNDRRESSRRNSPGRERSSSRRPSVDRDPEPKRAPEPEAAREPAPEPSKPKPSGSKVDDDFAALFGEKDSDSGASTSAPAKRDSGKTVYIPPAPGSGSVKETLGNSDIMEVVVANKSAIKRCTDEQKERDPDSSGTIVMRWMILKNGRTSGIQSVTAEYRKSELSACLSGVIKSFRFPAYSGPQMQPIEFPFKF